MMRQKFSFLLLGATLLVGMAGCLDGPHIEDTGSTTLFGLDESIACPEGEVGWRFPLTELERTSEEYVLQSGDNSVGEFTLPNPIEVQNARCNGIPSDAIHGIRNQCTGQRDCYFAAHCFGVLEVEYTCGITDRDEAGNQIVHRATAQQNSSFGTSVSGSLVCVQRPPPPPPPQTRTACVPRQCHGRARRDLNMQCVENPSAPEVIMEGGFGAAEFFGNRLHITHRAWIIPHYYPLSAHRDHDMDDQEFTEFNGEAIFPSMPYTVSLWARFWFGIVPETSSIVVWISDTYKNNATGDSVEGFRCVAFKHIIVPEVAETIGEDQGFAIDFEGVISAECVEGGRLSEDFAAKSLGITVSQFRQQYSYFQSKLRASYDMEGHTVLHRADTYQKREGLGFLAYHEPECAPNPQDFFYDNNIKTYDLISYYAQREVAVPKELHFVGPEVGRSAYIMPGEIRTANTLSIRMHSQFIPSLPIRVSWSAVNLNQENPFNPWAEGVDIGGAWEAGKSLPSANFAPTNLRASIFLYPWGQQPSWVQSTSERSPYVNKIGEIPLHSPNTEGKTDTINIRITDELKAYFLRNAGWFDHTRLYTVFYCIESDDHPDRPGNALTTRQGTYFYDCPNRDFCVGQYSTNYSMRESVPATAEMKAYSLHLDTIEAAAHSYQPFNSMVMRGCRVAGMPLAVHIDRFTTPVEPISSSGSTGSTNTVTNGDEKMSGTNDNDQEINCTGQANDVCVEVDNGGNRSDGEGGRSNFNLNSRLGRTPGVEANASMTGEMLGFQLIDPMDPVGSSVAFPASSSGASSNPLTITLAPDWDGIKEALERASTGSAEKWDVGRYGGQMGLGVGWGYKWTWSIGPVPVLVIVTFSVGVSVALEAQFQFGPTAEQQYPCIGTEPCIVMVDEAANFGDASRDCNIKGGRLAELSSSSEADAVDAIRGSTEIWLGAQLAYRHPKPACATNFNASECVPTSQTEYRWLSNSQTFASNYSESAATFTSENIHNATESGLFTLYPHDAAVVYRDNDTLGSVGVYFKRPYVCVFDAADSERFFRWQLALNMGAAAGFGLKGCVPKENPGLCLGASINIVGFTVGPVYENIFHWLYRAGESSPFGRRGNTNISVPWSLRLFEGNVAISVNFLWFSISWNLVTYDGIVAAEGKLYDSDTPVIESLE